MTQHRRLEAQWELLSDMLKIIHLGTTHLCSESTSSILPVLYGTMKHLEVKENDSKSIQRFKISVKSEIKSRWDLNNFF